MWHSAAVVCRRRRPGPHLKIRVPSNLVEQTAALTGQQQWPLTAQHRRGDASSTQSQSVRTLWKRATNCSSSPKQMSMNCCTLSGAVRCRLQRFIWANAQMDKNPKTS